MRSIENNGHSIIIEAQFIKYTDLLLIDTNQC